MSEQTRALDIPKWVPPCACGGAQAAVGNNANLYALRCVSCGVESYCVRAHDPLPDETAGI